MVKIPGRTRSSKVLDEIGTEETLSEEEDYDGSPDGLGPQLIEEPFSSPQKEGPNILKPSQKEELMEIAKILEPSITPEEDIAFVDPGKGLAGKEVSASNSYNPSHIIVDPRNLSSPYASIRVQERDFHEMKKTLVHEIIHWKQDLAVKKHNPDFFHGKRKKAYRFFKEGQASVLSAGISYPAPSRIYSSFVEELENGKSAQEAFEESAKGLKIFCYRSSEQKGGAYANKYRVVDTSTASGRIKNQQQSSLDDENKQYELLIDSVLTGSDEIVPGLELDTTSIGNLLEEVHYDVVESLQRAVEAGYSV